MELTIIAREILPRVPRAVIFWSRTPVDLNLETLKGEILNFLAASEFAIFHSFSGGLEELPVISWDTERFPDYRMFLEAAQKVGQKLILFASREFEEIEVEEALEGIEEGSAHA